MFVNHPEKLANAEKIFEAFFTTKATGMGPPISRSIIAAHEGRLWATPGSSRGTVLQVLLPFRTRASGEGEREAAKIERDRSVPIAEMIDASKAQRFHDRRKSSHTLSAIGSPGQQALAACLFRQNEFSIVVKPARKREFVRMSLDSI